MKSERRVNGRNLATLGGLTCLSLSERRGESVDLIWPPISRVIKEEEARERGWERPFLHADQQLETISVTEPSCGG